MKSTLGLLFLGLIVRSGLADVSHLSHSGHNHYLPPPIQDLPVDQDYNGLDSHPQNGDHGYLPPYQDGHGHGHGQYDDGFDPNIEISYHNDFAVRQPNGQVDDQSHGGHDDDEDNEDHVDIDHQQLEPIFPANFPVQGYYNPNAETPLNTGNGQRQGKAGRGEGHSISLVHYQHPVPLSSPAPFTLPQTTPLPHGGYDYPRPTKSADFLYPNENSGATSDLSEQDNTGGNDEQEQDRPGPNRGYLPPASSQLGRYNQQEYLPPVQSSHGSHQQSLGRDQQGGPQRDYLPPVQSNLGQLGADRGYLPPVQSNHHSDVQAQRGPQQDYLPPSQSNLELQGPQQDYLPPVQSHQHDGHLNRGYLPPNQENQARQSSDSHLHHNHNHNHHHHHHHQHPQTNQVLNTNSGNSLEQDYLPPVQSNHLQYAGPTQSNLGMSPPSLHQPEQGYLAPTNSPGALQLVTPPQLTSQSEQPRPASRVQEKGHINIPLPIPQVGYFFIPGIVSRLPSLTDIKNKGLQPALNIPGIINSEQPKPRPTQRLTSPEYTRAFLLQKKNCPSEHKASNIVITPSVQTLHQYQNGDTQENLLEGLDFVSPKQNLHTLVNYLQQTDDSRQYLPPHDQPQDHQNHEQSHEPSPSQELHGGQPLNPSTYPGRAYLPPTENTQDHHDHRHGQEQDLHHNHNRNNGAPKQRHTYHQESIVRGYLPPENQIQNQMTSLKTYMKGVHPSDRYGSSHYHQPPQNEKGNPPPPVGTSPPMYSNPSAIKAYAPGMAYRTSNNAPYSSFTPATYLPPVESAPPTEDAQENEVPIGLQLNEEAKRNLAMIMPKDNTIFPLDALLDSPDNEIDLPELMDQLRGRIRTVQIINNHANTAKTFRVLETADHKGVKTIKILGRAAEDPMGDHKVIRIISQGPHPHGFHQTVKIFAHDKEVTLPTTNAYLPPPKEKETLVRVLRNSQNELRNH